MASPSSAIDVQLVCAEERWINAEQGAGSSYHQLIVTNGDEPGLNHSLTHESLLSDANWQDPIM
jgi:hypothetical protein